MEIRKTLIGTKKEANILFDNFNIRNLEEIKENKDMYNVTIRLSDKFDISKVDEITTIGDFIEELKNQGQQITNINLDNPNRVETPLTLEKIKNDVKELVNNSLGGELIYFDESLKLVLWERNDEFSVHNLSYNSSQEPYLNNGRYFNSIEGAMSSYIAKKQEFNTLELLNDGIVNIENCISSIDENENNLNIKERLHDVIDELSIIKDIFEQEISNNINEIEF